MYEYDRKKKKKKKKSEKKEESEYSGKVNNTIDKTKSEVTEDSELIKNKKIQ